MVFCCRAVCDPWPWSTLQQAGLTALLPVPHAGTVLRLWLAAGSKQEGSGMAAVAVEAEEGPLTPVADVLSAPQLAHIMPPVMVRRKGSQGQQPAMQGSR